MKKIDHIGVAVNDFKAMQRIFDLLNIENHPPETVADQKVETLSFIVGESEIELLKPTAGDSPIAKYLEKKGIGIHHIALNVKNLENEIAQLMEAGVQMIDRSPRKGAGGKKIAFIHPKSSGGVLIELTES